MSQKKTILLKLTGEVIYHTPQGLNADKVRAIALQIKHLSAEFTFSIVTGGGNFFRGAVQGGEVAISSQVSHYVGMLATCMNGLIIQDIFETIGIKTFLLTAIEAPQIGNAISAQQIKRAQEEHRAIIFTGGTGNPYFTTDTNAVLRALQVNAFELWKGTKVEGVYTKDPYLYADAHLLHTLSYRQALDKELGIMDLSAFALAEQYKMPIRIFNIFAENALIKAAYENFGSVIKDIPVDKGVPL